jgi:hypothetical protein
LIVLYSLAISLEAMHMGTPESLANQMNSDALTLKLKCEACGHKAERTRGEAFKLYGMGASPFEIRRRSKCILCGTKGRIAVWI